ncbi:MAG: [FeFe] hydrogenase, group A [Bacteroidota bacterium]
MIFDIEVNNRIIKARKGETILSALNRSGIKVPTLCYMQEFLPTGNCRICVVEVEGKSNLIPACSHPVEEWMKIKTHSERVIKARKSLVELLLMNHPNDCLYCVRNGSCELQELSKELFITEKRTAKNFSQIKIDQSSSSIVRDISKCILCGRCIRICDELQHINAIDFIHRGNKTMVAPSLNKPLNVSSCINCGQCIMVCPTGALTEKSQITKVQDALHKKDTNVIVYYSPSITLSLAEEFGLKPGKDVYGILNAALKKIGFKNVFDSGFAADMVIMEQANELKERLENNANIPLFTSSCSSWIQYAEQLAPEVLPMISTCKSPQQMMGSIIKSFYAKEYHLQPENIYTVSIVPCTSKKFEALREEMTIKGISDVDAVITTREIARLIRLYGIDINNIEIENADEPFKSRSSAAKMFAFTGGTTEAILRTLAYQITGKESYNFKLNDSKLFKNRKEGKIKIGNYEIGVAIVNGIGNVSEIIEEIKAGRNDLHLIEVMTCIGGCIEGGGQPIGLDEKSIKAQIKTIHEIDENEIIKTAHKNPQIQYLYSSYFEKAGSEIAKRIIHTKYQCRNDINI